MDRGAQHYRTWELLVRKSDGAASGMRKWRCVFANEPIQEVAYDGTIKQKPEMDE
jgi:hypothetical protein